MCIDEIILFFYKQRDIIQYSHRILYHVVENNIACRRVVKTKSLREKERMNRTLYGCDTYTSSLFTHLPHS